MKSNSIIIASIILIHILTSNTCKKDYYDGKEFVRLSASINDTSQTINLGDTLKVKLTIPSIIISESGQVMNVNSVQKGQFVFVLYQFDTVSQRYLRIRDTNVISVSKGSIDSYLSSVYVTNIEPYESVLNIIPRNKGVYYIEIKDKGSLKVNNSYESFLKVNFNVLDIHNSVLSQYSSPDIGNSMLESQNNGVGFYIFRVD